MNASTAKALGSGIQDAFSSHFALSVEANRSMSKRPNVSVMALKASSESDHSVSASERRDSLSAIVFSAETMYEAKRKMFLLSHHCQRFLAMEERRGCWTEPNRLT